MLKVAHFTFNAFQENTYVIHNDKKQCWIVDPGMYDTTETQRLLNYIKKEEFFPQAIINTHTHLDHIFGVHTLMTTFQIPFCVHEKELPVLKNAAAAGALWGFRIEHVPQPTFFIKEQQPLTLGEDIIDVRFAPGHSPGSIVFYYESGKWVISGDVLFAGSIGRTDLPGGNYDTLISSIKGQLLTLPDETEVFSGHGPATNIKNERMFNPFLSSQ
jgi:hydroxyacylglutathione hydrolase